MRESVKNFIERVVDNEYCNIRVEANDMLSKIGTKEEIMDKVDGLYVIGFTFTGINSITITAGYYA